MSKKNSEKATVSETISNFTGEIQALLTKAEAELEAAEARVSEATKERDEVKGRVNALRRVVNPPQRTATKVSADYAPAVGTMAFEALTTAVCDGVVKSTAALQGSISKLVTTGYLTKLGHRQGFAPTDKAREYVASKTAPASE